MRSPGFAQAEWPWLFKVQRQVQLCAQGQAPRSTERSRQMVEQAWMCLLTPFHRPCLPWG